MCKVLNMDMRFLIVSCLIVIPLISDAAHIRQKRNKQNMTTVPIITTLINITSPIYSTEYPQDKIEEALKNYSEILPFLKQNTARSKRSTLTSWNNGECNTEIISERPIKIKTNDDQEYIVINHESYSQEVEGEKCLDASFNDESLKGDDLTENFTDGKICESRTHIVQKRNYKGTCEQQLQQLYLLTFQVETGKIERRVFQYNSACVCKLRKI